MKNNKMNKYIIWGLLINSLSIVIKQFIEIPDVIACFATGMGLSLLIFGLYAMNHDVSKLKKLEKEFSEKVYKLKLNFSKGWM